MQGQLAPCFVQEKLTETHMMVQTDEQNLETSQVDIYGMAELVAGYMDCMEEAVNYLKDVENYPDDHPAIIGLRKHLAYYRQKFVNEAIQVRNIESEISTELPSS